GTHPGNVVADSPDFPALEMIRGNHHGEIGLAASAGEGGDDIGLFASRRFNTQDEHVLSEPAFFAAKVRTDAQSETFLSEQHIAAVIRADRNDGVILRK